MMLIVLCCFSRVVVWRASSYESRESVFSFAFTNDRTSSHPRSIVCTTTGKRAVAEGPFVVRQWVPSWHGLLLCGDSGVYAWTQASTAPKLILDVAKLVPYVKSDFGTLTASVDSKGKRLAVYDNGGVVVIDLPTKRIIRRVTGDEIFKRLKIRSDAGPTENSGLAWSPDGSAIALTISEAMESNDGSHRERCVIVFQNGELRCLGDGVPVVWISNTEILGVANTFDVTVSPIVLRLDGRKPKKSNITAQDVGWDGNHILVGKKDKIMEVFDRQLSRRLENFKVPEYKNSEGLASQCSFIGIPASGAHQFFAKKS